MNLEELCKNSSDVKLYMGNLDADTKNKVLKDAAKYLVADTDNIIEANAIDVKNGIDNNMPEALIDRLRLDKKRIAAMADGLKQIASLNDPIGEVIQMNQRPNGLIITKKRVSIGVVGIIFEARPNVAADAFGLCFKTGNCSILKGGKDAINSNKAIISSIKRALEKHHVPTAAVQLIEDTDRDTTLRFMKMNQYVDLLIPRGGKGLIQSTIENSTIPVIETGTGNCHIYVDFSADLTKAVDIINNAKTQRVGVCNACESLVIHSGIYEEALPLIWKKLHKHNVEMRCDERAYEVLKGKEQIVRATDEDFGTEYLDYIISVKIVDSTDEAIDHINKYTTHHSESIITQNFDCASNFMNRVDSACVYLNASTRFSDGNEFGFGAEIGISTQKLHARGPMGLEALTSYKYIIFGEGQVR